MVAIKKKENAMHLPQRKSVELSKQVNVSAEIIWSDDRVLHTNARAHTYSEERQTAFLLPSVCPCKKSKITMMMIYEKEQKK